MIFDMPYKVKKYLKSKMENKTNITAGIEKL